MMSMLQYLNGIEYMLLIFSVLIVGSIAREHGTFYPVFSIVKKITKSDKLSLAFVSSMPDTLTASLSG